MYVVDSVFILSTLKRCQEKEVGTLVSESHCTVVDVMVSSNLSSISRRYVLSMSLNSTCDLLSFERYNLVTLKLQL